MGRFTEPVKRLGSVTDDDASTSSTELDSKGTRLDDGTVLDKHEVELSTWQLENVNAEYFLLFDHPLYGKLKKSHSQDAPAATPHLALRCPKGRAL